MTEGRILQMSAVKKKVVPLHTYIILLTNGEQVEVEAESYHDVGTDDGDVILYRWEKERATVLQLDAASVTAIVSKQVDGWEGILAATKKPVKARRKVSK